MSCHLVLSKETQSNMLKYKKSTDSVVKLPNYSKYEYANKLITFSEADCLLETELSMLQYYRDYKIEVSLKQFSDRILNDHLYMIYRKRQLKTPSLIRKLVSFFVHHYKKPLTTQVNDYLNSKKLTLDDWLKSVQNNRRGDILCVFPKYGYRQTHLCPSEKWSGLEYAQSSTYTS